MVHIVKQETSFFKRWAMVTDPALRHKQARRRNTTVMSGAR
jgi:hypothetical protein